MTTGISGMKNTRPKSPAAPSHALDEALTKASKLYEAAEHRAMSVDAAAKAMGHMKARQGIAAKSLATLKMYGLLESRGIGRVALTQSFRRYRLESRKSTRQTWLIEFVKKPKIFAMILAAYPGRLPSDETLKHLLVCKGGFMEERAGTVIRCFRRSMAFADVDIPLIDGVSEPRITPVRSTQARQSESQEIEVAVMKAAHFVWPISGVSDLYDASIPVRLAGGRKAWITLPKPFFDSDKDILRAQIELLHTDEADHDAPV